MTRVLIIQASSIAAAALMTFATFVGAGAIASDAYRVASMAQLQAQATAVAAVQRVTVVGRRSVRT